MKQLISLLFLIGIIGGGVYFVRWQFDPEKLEQRTQEGADRTKKKVDEKVDRFRDKLNENLPPENP